MTKRNNNKYYNYSLLSILVAIFALAISSCRDNDFDFEEHYFNTAEQQFQKQFHDQFGEIDPEQDWVTATAVTANISNLPNGILEIFTENPISLSAYLLAKKEINGTESSIKFDIPKGKDRVYAHLLQGKSYYPVKGYFAVENGCVSVSPNTVVTRSGEASPVTKGESMSYSVPVIDWDKQEQFELVQDLNNTNGSGDSFIDGQYKIKDGGQKGQTIDNDNSLFKWQNVEKLYKLDNVDLSQHFSLNLRDVAHFFMKVGDEDPVFKEEEFHYNYMNIDSPIKFSKDVVYTVAEAGPVTLDYFANGNPCGTNGFGYFYFTDEDLSEGQISLEKFRSFNKFVLVDNITDFNSGLLKQNMYNAKDFQNAGNMVQSISWSTLESNNYKTKNYDNNTWEDAKLIGTTLQLTYFDAEGTASYTFPEGTRIGFFLLNGRSGQKIYTSISTINRDLCNEPPRAVTYKYRNQIVLGFEDEGKNALSRHGDINDIMFFVNGNFEEDIPDIDPDPEVPVNECLIAYEDMGTVGDFDFNDVVISVSAPIDGYSTVKLKAAGGTLETYVTYYLSETNSADLFFAQNGNPTQVLDLTSSAPSSVGTEVHEAFGVKQSVMVNTIKGQNKSNLTPTAKIKVPDGWTVSENARYFAIKVQKEQEQKLVHIPYFPGNVPEAFLIADPSWTWPEERQPIYEAYSGFEDWVKDNLKSNWYDKFYGEAPDNGSGSGTTGGNNNTENPGNNPGSGSDTPSGAIVYSKDELSTMNNFIPGSTFTNFTTGVKVSITTSQIIYSPQASLGDNWLDFTNESATLYSYIFTNESEKKMADLKVSGLTLRNDLAGNNVLSLTIVSYPETTE